MKRISPVESIATRIYILLMLIWMGLAVLTCVFTLCLMAVWAVDAFIR